MIQEMLIYEFESNYFLLQRGQQGKNPTLRASHQYPSENVRLSCKLPLSCPPERLGEAIVETLDNFDTVSPKYDAWEFKELNKQMCEWLETRYFATITKNSRLVQVIREGNKLTIYPFDNHTKQPWYGPMTKNCGFRKEKFFVIPSDSAYEIIGKYLFDAFTISTYHPERKTKNKASLRSR